MSDKQEQMFKHVYADEQEVSHVDFHIGISVPGAVVSSVDSKKHNVKLWIKGQCVFMQHPDGSTRVVPLNNVRSAVIKPSDKP